MRRQRAIVRDRHRRALSGLPTLVVRVSFSTKRNDGIDSHRASRRSPARKRSDRDESKRNGDNVIGSVRDTANSRLSITRVADVRDDGGRGLGEPAVEQLGAARRSMMCGLTTAGVHVRPGVVDLPDLHERKAVLDGFPSSRVNRRSALDVWP